MTDNIMPSIYDYSAITITGESVSMANFQAKVVLIVNVASHCGFTAQYAGLEKLYQTYRERNFVVLGFPCNQFAGQESGTEAEILAFCNSHYQVSFPLFAKIHVNGKNAHPLYNFLKKNAKGILGTQAIKWNFTKFLVNRQGIVMKRYAPAVAPALIEKDILDLL